MPWRCCCRPAIGRARSGQWAALGRRATSLLNRKATCLTTHGAVICAWPARRRWRPDTASVICPALQEMARRTEADISGLVVAMAGRRRREVQMASRDAWASTRTQRLLSRPHPANQRRPCHGPPHQMHQMHEMHTHGAAPRPSLQNMPCSGSSGPLLQLLQWPPTAVLPPPVLLPCVGAGM